MNLPDRPDVPDDRLRRLHELSDHHANEPSGDLADLVHRELQVDLSTVFAGQPVAHPFGKASGQLSCTARQVEEDVAAGLAFIVLKTVIAEDERAHRSMAEWATEETRMSVERLQATSGRAGWTVTWKGRGWHGTFDSYLNFCREAFALGARHGVPVIPSVKYHLPVGNEPYRTGEYVHTTSALHGTWRRSGMSGPLVIEKDFSPTLAGDERAAERDTILRWLHDVPHLIAAGTAEPVRVGIKLMNALFGVGFQQRMVQTVLSAQTRPAWLTVFNRLFDSTRAVAYGGYDLSDRNLDVLRQMGPVPVPLSATGNICTGRMMLEYALAGCATGQIHTFFQVPRTEYLPGNGNRSVCALRTLLLHPTDGLVPWLWHCEQHEVVPCVDGVVRFRDVVGANAD